MKGLLRRLCASFIVLSVVVSGVIVSHAHPVSAAEGEFFIQVSPSPLVATVKPGQKTTLELKIRNAASATEKLTITPRAFKVSGNGKIEFNDTQPPEVADWLSFSEKDFTVAPGQWFTQKISIDMPKEAGFSYSFALIVTRQGEEAMRGGQALKGQVAVFALLNVDRPGAKRELQLESLKTDAGIYEYLPSIFTLRLKNTGNTIVQPVGNLFVQRGSADETPINALEVNEAGGYILPGTVRELAVKWDNGFPVVKRDESQNPAREYTDWNWSDISDFRLGHYTAKAVVIYNDGQRDIPLVAEVGFWVIPWKIILGFLLVFGLIGLGIWSLIRQIGRVAKRGKKVRLRR